MSCWIEYWDKDRQLFTIITSYVPKKGDYIKIKLSKVYKFRKVINVLHIIDKTDEIREKFQVFVY